jgi:cytochrome oxidase Cu insertion factor (SCO1/SenC/PrrC family)
LGAVTEFWLKPGVYARFLGIELSMIYKGPLLIVMPNGFGLEWPGHSTVSAARLLTKIQVKATGTGLLATVEAAVRVLAGSVGTSVGASTIDAAAGAHGASHGHEVLIAVAVAAAIAIAALGFGLRRGRQTAPGKPSIISRRVLVGSLGWTVPVLALVIALAVIVRNLASSSHPRVHGIAAVTENSPSIFPPHQRRAPSFQLRDQEGRPVSIAAYHGHPVIVTFIDPLSPELEPREVQILNEAELELPISQRPEIIAVSVDVYGDARTNLVRDLARWHLAPQWRWAVGAPKQLASVWNSYYAVVDVINKKLGATTVHSVIASRMAYLIDPSGYERALFGWPYGVNELDRTVLHPGDAPRVTTP